VIGFAVVAIDHDAVDRCKDRAADAEEPFGRFRADEGPPVRIVRRPTSRIHADGVDRIPFPQQVGSMTRHSPGRTVLGRPPGSERQREDDPTGGRDDQSADLIAAVYAT
jgi:hypothetical protein